jgi:hypothetical protein
MDHVSRHAESAHHVHSEHVNLMSTEPQVTTSTTARESGSLEFTDGVGVRWSVWEIENPGFSEKLLSLFPHPERRSGWLLFESAAGERRRLSPYPANWRTLGSFGLATQCLLATASGRNEKRRRSDAP